MANRSTLSQNVPRYTSYPTAPHFDASIGAAVYKSWLAGLDPHARLSLYLHVPFCSQLCLYCGCHTKVTLRRRPVEAYADRLVDEIALVAKATGRRQVVNLHWGGGTPTILGAEQLIRIHDALADAFELSALAEHAIELDPRHLTEPLTHVLSRIGVNRASLGVQDLNLAVQIAMGRVQPFETIANATGMLRAVGIEQINFDLMYGLPGQTIADIRNTIPQAHSLSPDRLAVFGYAHVPWMKSHQRLIDPTTLPGLEERLAQAGAAHEALMGLGYQAIGLDHYARPDDALAVAAREGRLRRNFQGYTADQTDALIGIGASAIGRLPAGYTQNAPDIGGYVRAIEAGQFATVRGIAFTCDDRARAHVIERIMCDMSIDLDSAADDMGTKVRDYFAGELRRLAPFARDGLINVDAHRIIVTEKGRPYLRVLAATFDAYLQPDHGRHSLAV